MHKMPLWKPLLVVGVLLACAVAIYPPSRKMKPGLDLAGGTVLVYEVEVPRNADANAALEETIRVLQRRVDPLGQRSLVWLKLGGNRIEIQMPAASRDAARLRAAYQEAREKLLASDLNVRQLDLAMRLTGPAQAQRFRELAGGDPARQAVLESLLQAVQARQALRQPYDQAQALRDQLEAELAKAPEEARAALGQRLTEAAQNLEAQARALLEADRKVDQTYTAVLARNIGADELDRILALPTRAPAPRTATGAPPGKRGNPRQDAVDRLAAAHGDRADLVRQVAQAYALYEGVRRPLDDPNDLIALLRGQGVLEFRIAPSPRAVTATELQEYRQQLQAKGLQAGVEKPYRWFEIDDPDTFAEGRTPTETERKRQAMHQDAAGYFANARGLIGDSYHGKICLLLANTSDKRLTKDEGGWAMRRVMQGPDERNMPAVAFELDTVGGQLMAALTGAHIGQPMAILLDGRVLSSPNIQTRIPGHGIITGGRGGFSPRDLEYLINTMRAGSLQAKLSNDPILIQTIGASFGEDNLHAGMRAAIIALMVVAAFMACYYFFWGMVANFAMASNLLIVMGVMALLNATYTLPGIAGLILTIGMAVDANVLIYERIREELERRADLATAVRLGFDRAFTTILDSNLTTAITCWILADVPPFDLFQMPTDIKGFGVTLGIGVMANLFTGVFCTRVVIELWLRLFKPRSLPMLATVFPAIHRRLFTINVDWYGKRWFFIPLSAILTVAGLAALVVRGPDFLDIEFRGGTKVEFHLSGGRWLSIAEVRQRLDRAAQLAAEDLTARRGRLETALATAGPDQKPSLQKQLDETRKDLVLAPRLAGSDAVVVPIGDRQGDKAAAFAVSTLLTNPNLVSAKVKEAFRDVLDVAEAVHFAGMGPPDQDAPPIQAAPVAVVRYNDLGPNVGRPERTAAADPRYDVGPYLGGAAIMLQDMKPPTTVAEIRQRIERIRQMPNYRSLGPRQLEVVGLDPAPAGAGAAAAEPRYLSAVVLVKDAATHYLENPEAFVAPGGLAAVEWDIVRQAMLRDTTMGSITNFSPQISGDMVRKALVAIVLSWMAMLAYIWLRFGNLRYGFGAVAALVHDVLIAVGLAALCKFVWDTPVGHALMLENFHLSLTLVAAALTLIGYSVNDTIVTFDRIRENRGRLAFATPQIINDSINQTLSRTILTAGTVVAAVLVMYIWGGTGMHGFAFIMLVGALVGCYSSIAIASPLLLVGVTAEQLGLQPRRPSAGQTAPSPAAP